MIVALWKGEKIVEVASIFQEALESQWQQLPTYRLLVLGEAGVGKTTLIQSLFDLKKNENIPQFQVDEVSLLQELPTSFNYDACIYCLNGSSNDFSLETKESLFRIANHLPTIIALTQSIGTKAEQFQSQLVDLSLPVKGIINVMAKPYPIYESVHLPSFGLEEMLDLLYECVDGDKVATLISLQKIDCKKKLYLAKQTVEEEMNRIFQASTDARQVFRQLVEVLGKVFAYFGNEIEANRVMEVLENLYQRKFQSYQELCFVHQQSYYLVMILSACCYSGIEMMALLSKKENSFTIQESSILLETKIASRMKQGKHNAEVQAFIVKHGLELEEPSIQKPVIHVPMKKKTLFEKIQKQSRQFMHHSLDAFSKWARK
ncbi:hypothetical protein [uncultured Granulicatella sp.]|jgi:hypothetical protein|uniref:hypothetical protein n=1 Tax=uncultured Granulicatella sp. TaxID=316089 RepID=UPI0028DB12B7|nr:hypothetical protein [uncultured Granulicatella sp.]